MSLLGRLTSVDDDKIFVHQFFAVLVEFAGGEFTRQQVIDLYSMDAATIADLDWLIGKYQASAGKNQFLQRIHSIFILAEKGVVGYQLQSELVAVINRIP